MPASDKHPNYTASLPQWKLVRDCVEGAPAIEKGGVKYLPRPNAGEYTYETDVRYQQYLKRASFVSFTSSTLEGLLGMVFRKHSQVELQSSIEYLKDNATGSGISLDQMARSSLSSVLQCGRHGFLVDYPEATAGLSVQSVSSLGLRANILPYRAENVLNWQVATINGITVLSLVTLCEIHQELSEDGFSFEEKEYSRVLRLVDGLYQQELYDNEEMLVSVAEPRMSTGQRWNIIPFTFCGATNNDYVIDKSPLYDIANVNISHYRNSADFEESSFIVGQPTLAISGLSQTWIDNTMKGGVSMGSGTSILLPEGGNAFLLQAGSNSMPEIGMKMKEQQMVMLGARLITDSGGTETAEAARIRYAGQNSKLSNVVGNLESALMQCFEWAMLFMGGTGENEYELNHEYYDKTIDAQRIMAEIQLMDRGVTAMTDIRSSMREHGVIDSDRTDEEINSEAEITDL